MAVLSGLRRSRGFTPARQAIVAALAVLFGLTLLAVAGTAQHAQAQTAVTVSGIVTDGSGHGWPLYARIDVAGQPNPVFTDPVTGTYQVALPEAASYDLTVTAFLPGYQPQTRTVAVATDPLTQNFALQVAANCDNPAYRVNPGYVRADFETGLPPGWSVVNRTNGGGWAFNDPGNRGNLTGGSGRFAIVDSLQLGFGPSQDSDLITPHLDFSAATAPLVTFNSAYRANATNPNSSADVDYSLDGGSSWTNAWHQVTTLPGPGVQRVALTGAAGAADVLVRFRYRGAGSFWWQVDNVVVGDPGAGPCAPRPGGLVVGNVYAAATGVAINGATVTSVDAPADTTSTLATPDDPNIDDGFYLLFSTLTGTHPFTADAPTMTSSTAPVDVAANGTVEQNFRLNVEAATVTGTVTDGGPHGWPLYARIDISGYSGGPVFTDPVTGRFSAALLQGTPYTFTVTALSPGYSAQSRAVTLSTTSAVEDFALPLTSDCSAPGYAPSTSAAPVLAETFGTGLPPGWSVVNHTASGGWVFNDPGQRGNLTGGAGGFAIIDSDQLGIGNTQDTELITPALDLSASRTPQISFASDYRSLRSSANVDVSTDGGATWTTVWEHTDDSRRGPVVERVALAGAGGHADVRIRFHFVGTWAWWWEIDDVQVAEQCTVLPGGLVVGNVTDSADVPVNGATVTSVDAPADTATTAATPDDPALADGFYTLFSSLIGSQPFTATEATAGRATANVDVHADGVVRQDFKLGVGQLAVDPTSLSADVPVGGQTTLNLTLTNTGTAAAAFNIAEGATAADIPWLSVDPATGTIAPGTSVDVAVALDAATIDQPGTFTGQLVITTDTGQSIAPVPVTMNVVAPPSWGRVSGIVTGLGRCDTAGAPLAGAVVQIGGVTLTTDSAGAYSRWLAEGTYPVSVSYSGYTTATGEAVVTAGGSATRDFQLRLDAPCATVSPTSLAFVLDQGGTDSATLSLTNAGAAAYTFEITGAPPWLAVTPAAGSVAGDASTTVQVAADATGLDPGDYQATLTVATSDPAAAAIQVRVSLTVNGTPPVGQTKAWIVVDADCRVGNVAASSRDVLAVNNDGTITKVFNGSAAGVRSGIGIDGLALIPQGMVLSFTAPTRVPGISTTVDDSDLVLYANGTFSLWFDGSDVGLSTEDEDIDAVDVLPDGSLIISTLGEASVNGISAQGEDLLKFTPTSLGSQTAGTWSRYFDGSDVGLSGDSENIDAVAVEADGSIGISTYGRLRVGSFTAEKDDVARFVPTSLGRDTAGSFAPDLILDGSTLGLGRGVNVTAVELPD